MPRKAKPPGNPGRPDLDQRQPVRTPVGLPYGQKQSLAAQQSAAPLPAAPAVAGGGGGLAEFAQALESAKAMPFPNQTLGAPTALPNEPVTAGIGVGPGAGAIPLSPPRGAPSVAQTYARIAAETGDPEFLAMAQTAAAQGA